MISRRFVPVLTLFVACTAFADGDCEVNPQSPVAQVTCTDGRVFTFKAGVAPAPPDYPYFDLRECTQSYRGESKLQATRRRQEEDLGRIARGGHSICYSETAVEKWVPAAIRVAAPVESEAVPSTFKKANESPIKKRKQTPSSNKAPSQKGAADTRTKISVDRESATDCDLAQFKQYVACGLFAGTEIDGAVYNSRGSKKVIAIVASRGGQKGVYFYLDGQTHFVRLPPPIRVQGLPTYLFAVDRSSNGLYLELAIVEGARSMHGASRVPVGNYADVIGPDVWDKEACVYLKSALLKSIQEGPGEVKRLRGYYRDSRDIVLRNLNHCNSVTDPDVVAHLNAAKNVIRSESDASSDPVNDPRRNRGIQKPSKEIFIHLPSLKAPHKAGD